MADNHHTYNTLSLFTGAGGLDIGFENAGFNIVAANEFQKDAAATFMANHPSTKMIEGDVEEHFDELSSFDDIDIIIGGPPCQGFSVAGKMNPDDPRSSLIFTFLDMVEKVRPKAFVMENVKALAKLKKWEKVRQTYLEKADSLGYKCEVFTLMGTDFGVSQKRERCFFVGIDTDTDFRKTFEYNLSSLSKKPETVKKLLLSLDRAGTSNNPLDCPAKIRFTKNPILRSTPFAGMLFNGAGRPIDLDGYANTLIASMGGSGTPIVDDAYLYGESDSMWIVDYHKSLVDDIANAKSGEAPKRLRRITIKEAALLQSFPKDYIWCGAKSSIYKQIGNAVPPLMAFAVAQALKDTLNGCSVVQ